MVSYCLIMLLWSGVGGQLFSSCCCGQGLVVSYSHHVAVVRGWWSAMVSYCLIMLLWSGVGGQLFSHHVGMVKGWWSAILTSCCCGQGLVVHVGGQLRTRSLEEPFRGAFGKNKEILRLLTNQLRSLGIKWIHLFVFLGTPVTGGCCWSVVDPKISQVAYSPSANNIKSKI